MASLNSFYVNFNEFESNIGTIWQKLQSEQDFFDMTLVCDGQFIQTHKLVISAVSPILRNILKQNLGQYPFIYLRGIKYNDLNNLLNFIYQGHVYIPEEDIYNFLEIGKELEISGITEIKNLISAPKPSQHCNNPIKLVSNKENMEADATENIKAENTESVVKYITDLDNDYKLNEAVEKIEDNIKIEAPIILAKCTNENELHSKLDLNMKEDEPEKKIIYASEITESSADIEPYCNLCKKMYNTFGSLKVHKAQIHEGVNYPCDQCDYKGTSKYHLNRHTQSIHEGKRHPCDKCDKDYNDASALNYHKKVVHDGIRKQCDMCGKKFRGQNNLRAHIKISLCGKKFKGTNSS